MIRLRLLIYPGLLPHRRFCVNPIPTFVLAEAGAGRHIQLMKRLFLMSGLAVLASLAVLRAEENAAAPAGAAAEAIRNLEIHIAQREQRLAEWGKDIVELDARIEKRVAELVKMLAAMGDQGDADGKVTKLKQDAIAGLKRAMDAYVGKRAEVAEKISAGDADAQGDLDKFDERIHTRVDQIAELAKSVPADQDVGESNYEDASYWNGYFFEMTRLREKEKEKQGDDSAKDDKDPAGSLKKNIDLLDKRRSTLQNLLTRRNSTEASINLYTRELGKLDAYKDHLKERLRDFTLASVESGKPIPMDGAHDFAQILDDARSDLREDVSRLFRTYDQFAKGRTYVAQLKASLAARKEWAEKNPPAKP
jgi:predicted  nucleic acid-binding Zn-ribbon protein